MSPSNPVVVEVRVNLVGRASRFSMAAPEAILARAAARTVVMVNFILNDWISEKEIKASELILM
jgi:hypothetical protein